MRLVAWVVADEANDRTRRTIGYRLQGYERRNGQWRDGICEQTGLCPRTVQQALRDLAAAGYELRVAIGKDSAGRPVYARRGHATDFTVPELAARPPVRGRDSATQTPVRGPDSATQTGGIGGQILPPRSPHTDPLTKQSPHMPAPPGAAPPALKLTDPPRSIREEGTMPAAPKRANNRAPTPGQAALVPFAMPAPETSTREAAHGGTVAVRAAAGFDDFWAAYPRRVAKGAARKAWEQKVVKGNVDPAQVIAGAARYAAERAGQPPEYTKHPATWLRAECWADEPLHATPLAALRSTLQPGDANVLDHLAAAAELDRRFAGRAQ